MACHLTQETRVQSAMDDVASNSREALPSNIALPKSQILITLWLRLTRMLSGLMSACTIPRFRPRG